MMKLFAKIENGKKLTILAKSSVTHVQQGPGPTSLNICDRNASLTIQYKTDHMTFSNQLYFCSYVFSFFWGYIGDIKGKKFALIVACIGVSIVSLAFGFSDSFWWALCTRFLQGAFGKYLYRKRCLKSDSHLPKKIDLFG